MNGQAKGRKGPIASGIINNQFIEGKLNSFDLLSKQWEHHDIWYTLKPILFWTGDTMEYFNNDILE